jgi:Flp pilus assembly protein TadD
LIFLAASPPSASAPGPSGPARACLEAAGEAAVTACRQALAASLPAARAATLRRMLAVRLAQLGRADEVVEVYRQAVQARPSDADAQLRLGRALLQLSGHPEQALAPLQEAVRLRPTDASAHSAVGLVLAALGRNDEAVAAFAEAERLEPGHFDSRPAARATFEAARRGERWP